MSDALSAVAAEATRPANGAVLVKIMHGRTWRFGALDVRPSRLRRLARLAATLADADPSAITDADALELFADAEDLLAAALAPTDRAAFDTAPFTGTEIGRLTEEYFAALGASLGESAASPASSPSTPRRSRPTSRKRARR